MQREIDQTTHVLRSRALRVREELQKTLRSGCLALGTETGLFTDLRDGEHWIQQIEGDADGLESAGRFTLAEVLDERLRLAPVVVRDLRELPIETGCGVGAFAGQTIELDAEVIGVLCFFGSEVREAEFPAACDFLLDLIASRISALLEQLRVDKRLQGQLVDVQKLESLGLLAGGVAHDFNNLLTSIVGNAHLAKAEVSQEEGAQRCLDSILVAADRATKLTHQLLAYSGEGAFVLSAVDVSACVSGMAALLHSLIPKKVELRLDTGVKLPTIHADEGQLKQIVMSLVMNSAESIEGPGTVWVRTGKRFLDAAQMEAFVFAPDLQPGTCVYLEVRDTGSGMGEEILSKIFDPFFSTKFTGRGLGLAAVLGIVRGHGAALSVSSTPEGSVFTAYFGVHSSSSNRHLESVGQEGADGPLVLVVDNEELVRSACCLTLRSLGYASITASDGPEALEIFEKSHRALAAVILDMGIPDLDGVETYELMREISEVVPVIVSGYSESELLAHLDVPPVEFLPKPYTPGILAEKLRKVLQA